jgi:hypothetical protein
VSERGGRSERERVVGEGEEGERTATIYTCMIPMAHDQEQNILVKSREGEGESGREREHESGKRESERGKEWEK